MPVGRCVFTLYNHSMTHWDVAIIGGGPAGLIAAARAAQRGRRTILIDKNREPGVKILISGGTRCNFTHDTDARGIIKAFGPSGRFLHSALAALGPRQVSELFQAEGLGHYVEPGGKVFPASDRAADIRAILVRRAEQNGCAFAMSESLVELQRRANGFELVTSKRTLEADKVLLATGGQSYPACGTTGDGYRWAAALGHRIVELHTALAPITSHAAWVTDLQGITLPDVLVRVLVPNIENGRGKKSPYLAERRGALLFTHFGVSGPAAMDVSHVVSDTSHPNALVLRCDLLPDLSESELDLHLAREISQSGRRRASVLLDHWLPHRVGETVITLAETPLDRPLAELSKAARRRIAHGAKHLDIPTAGTMGYRKAEVTAGGVSLDEVDSRTMQSKLVPGLFFAGEVLDLNGPVGGYNFQAAFSTGWLAGESV